MSRLKNPIYKGYKAGTVVGLAGDAILDALLTESDVPETRKIRKARDYVVKFGSKRKYKTDCRPRKRRSWRTY